MDLSSTLSERLLFAVPKKGRLHQLTLDLLQGADIQFHRHNRLDIALCKNIPAALVFLPAADIPTFVGEGKVSLGITGRDQVLEHDAGVEEILDLGFGGCKLQVQVPAKGEIQDARGLVGKTVVTSFVNLTEKYFRELGGHQKTTIKYVGGSVEAAWALGVADGVVDLVESGETMRVAGLKAVDTVVESSAVLIQSRHPTDPKLVENIKTRIKGWIVSQKFVTCRYNIQRGNLEEACRIAPGKRNPTVTTLYPEADGWVAVEVMIAKRELTDKMDALWAAGAQDIVVFALLNTRTAD